MSKPDGPITRTYAYSGATLKSLLASSARDLELVEMNNRWVKTLGDDYGMELSSEDDQMECSDTVSTEDVSWEEIWFFFFFFCSQRC